MADIEKKQVSFVAQATSVDGMLEQWRIYEDLKTKLRGEGDFIPFKTRDGKVMETPTKKWRVKLERFFGISVEIVDVKEEDIGHGEKLYTVKARATHSSGAYHEALGSCSTKEKERSGARKYHDALSHAETRAKNRAVFEFVGMGEVSAEEIETNGDFHPGHGKPHRNPGHGIISEKQKGFIEKLLRERVHEDISKAQKILGIDLKTLEKKRASEIIEKLQEVVTIEKRKDLMRIAEGLGWTNEDLLQFLKDNNVNPYLITEKQFNELSETLISFSRPPEDTGAEEIE